jgi:hypothetical protein
MLKLLTSLMVLLMTISGFTKVDEWENFNSSLLIEVTRPNGVFTCTGVAVSTHTLVTAAHCLDGEIKSVRIFTQSSYDPKQPSLAISGFQLHPSYNQKSSRYRCDMAKITMKEKLPSFIKLHQIQQVKTGDIIYGNIYRFGFGERNKKNLRTVVTPGLRRVNNLEDVLELNDEFSRSGDSGGPVFIQNGTDVKILAVHSTFSTGPQGNFSLNPLLGSHLPWIFSH